MRGHMERICRHEPRRANNNTEYAMYSAMEPATRNIQSLTNEIYVKYSIFRILI